MSTAIVWFRRDLRLVDNPALAAAWAAHDQVLPVYVHAPAEEAPWSPGAASRWWLHHALLALDADLRRRGSHLHVCEGGSLQALRRLLVETGAQAVYWNRLYDPATLARDATVKRGLADSAVSVESYNAALLIEPWKIATQQGTPYRIFTPFWRNLRDGLSPRPPQPAPRRLRSPQVGACLKIDALDLMPAVGWDSGLRTTWQPDEAGAQAEGTRFFHAALADYIEHRDIPSLAGTSRLSPYLHFGQIGPMQLLWQLKEVRQACHRDGAAAAAAGEAFLRELGWREFAHHLLFHFPQTSLDNLNPQFGHFPWRRESRVDLRRWQRGRTGIPIVDAGMRELWHTGWMHNRVRMIVASFLTKNLRQHWIHGARWFWDTLVDADLPNNTQGWQWTAGSGADAAPYFRIFNPVSQGERFDPQGDYVRRWLPELAHVAPKWIHKPWENAVLAGTLDYPAPMVDLKDSRKAALLAYQQMRARA